MGGLGMWLRAEMRARWRAWLAVGIIAGVGWGAVLTAVAGARRTESAFPRFLAYSHAAQALVTPSGVGYRGYSAEISRLPQVAEAAPLAGMNLDVIDPKPPKNFAVGAPFFPLDGRLGHLINRPKLLSGRLPNPANAHEALVSPTFADPLGIHPGARVTFEISAEQTPGNFVDVKRWVVRIVGIGVTQNEVFPITIFDRAQSKMLLTPAAWRAIDIPEADAFDGVVIRLKPGASVSDFQRGAQHALAHHPEAGGSVFFSTETERPIVVSRAMRPLVIALAAFAAALGLTLLLVMTQTIGRQVLIHGADYAALRSLGASPRALIASSVAPVAASALIAAAIAVSVALAASPLTPIGAARLAEPYPGVAADWLVLSAGAVFVVITLIAGALIPARRAVRAAGSDTTAADPETGSLLADRLSRAGFSAHASAGIRMALGSGRGRSAVPVRPVMLGAIVSMLALTAAFTFGASLDRAVSTPRTFGQGWDRDVDAQFTGIEAFSKIPVDDPSYAAVAAGAYSPGLLDVNGAGVPAIALDQLKGSLFPTLLAGRAPRTAKEIVLGTSTMRRLQTALGAVVRVTVAGTQVPMRVVGRAVFPAMGIGAFTPTDLGEGAALTTAGLGAQTFLAPRQHSFYLVRFAPHPAAAAVKRIDDACGPVTESGGLCLVFKGQRPPEIASYTQVRPVPWVLAGLLAALTAATLAHGLLATVRRRRRDLAVFKTLGFMRRQVSGAVAWQASTLVAVALLGIPIGIALGRWAWISLASQLGIAADPRIPATTVALTIPAALLLANLVAAIPARSAARTSAALVLRTE